MYKVPKDKQGLQLSIDHSSVAIHFKDDISVQKRLKTVSKTRCTDPAIHHLRIEVPKEKYTIFPITPSVSKTSYERFNQVVSRLNKNRHVVRVNNVYTLNGKKIIATDRIILSFHPDFSGNKGNELKGFQYTRLNELNHDVYVVTLNEEHDVFEIAEQLKAKASIKYAEPDFITIGMHIPSKNMPLGSSIDD